MTTEKTAPLDPRQRIDAYLHQSGLATRAPRVVPLTGDASDRRYFRILLKDGASIVLSLYAAPFDFGTLSFVNVWLIPDVLHDVPHKIGLNFDLTELSFGIFGFLLVIMMVLRPEGLLPERRRKLELTEGIGTGEVDLPLEVTAP